MKVSTKGRYALRMMVDLAVHGEKGNVSLRDISQRQEYSMKYMEQIVSQLTKAGLLISVQGPRGGYRLARPPAAYTAGEILRVTEGSLAPISCLDHDPVDCPRVEYCSTMDFWKGFYKTITDYMDGVTLQDLLDHEKERLAKETQP